MNFKTLPLSKKSLQITQNQDFSPILNQIIHNLGQKLLKKEIKCECENKHEICFDCLRTEAESELADQLDPAELQEDELETYSDTLDRALDQSVADLVRNYEG